MNGDLITTLVIVFAALMFAIYKIKSSQNTPSCATMCPSGKKTGQANLVSITKKSQ